MARTKIRDRIQLSDGRVMTLGEALDQGLVTLRTAECRGREAGIPGKQYLATEAATGLSWDVGKTLYESRTGEVVFKKGPRT